MSADVREHRSLAATGSAAPAPIDAAQAERRIELAPGLHFSTHPLAEQPPFCDAPLHDDALRLWLLRPEWQLLSREDAFARLSPHERKRTKCFPQPSIGKRFAVGRAVLRGILGGMLAVPPKSLEIVDHESGRVTLNLPDAKQPIDIAVAYAGIWILIGIGAQPLGLATAFSTGDVVNDDEQHRVRLASVAAAAGTPSAAGYLCQTTDTHAHRVHTHDAGTWRVIDLPMPGRQCIASVAAREIRDVQASGWNSSVKLPAPPRANARGRRTDAQAGVAAGLTRTG